MRRSSSRTTVPVTWVLSHEPLNHGVSIRPTTTGTRCGDSGVDEATRPWVTVCLDAATGYVLAAAVSAGPPAVDDLERCLVDLRRYVFAAAAPHVELYVREHGAQPRGCGALAARLARHGIVLTRGRPYQPEPRGRTERMLRSLHMAAEAAALDFARQSLDVVDGGRQGPPLEHPRV